MATLNRRRRHRRHSHAHAVITDVPQEPLASLSGEGLAHLAAPPGILCNDQSGGVLKVLNLIKALNLMIKATFNTQNHEPWGRQLRWVVDFASE